MSTENKDYTAFWPDKRLEEFRARGQRFLTALPPPLKEGAANGRQFVPRLEEFAGYYGQPSTFVGVLRPEAPVEHPLEELRGWMDEIRALALTDPASLYAHLEPHMSAWVQADDAVEQLELYGALALAQLLFTGAWRNQFPTAKSPREAVAQFLKSHRRGHSDPRISCALGAAEFYWEIHATGDLPLPANFGVIERLAPQAKRIILYRGLAEQNKRAPTQAEVIALLVDKGVQRVSARDLIKTEVAKRARAMEKELGNTKIDLERVRQLAGEIHAIVKPMFGRRRSKEKEADEGPPWDPSWGCPFTLRWDGADLGVIVSEKLPPKALNKYEKQATDLGWFWDEKHGWEVALCRENDNQALGEANEVVEILSKLCLAIDAPVPPAFLPKQKG